MYSNLSGMYDTGSSSNVNPVNGLPENKLLIVKNNNISTATNMNVLNNLLTVNND